MTHRGSSYDSDEHLPPRVSIGNLLPDNLFPAPRVVSESTESPVVVAPGETLVVESMATISGTLEVGGRADIYGRVAGHITVLPSGWLNLYGVASRNIWIEPDGSAHIAGQVVGKILGDGRSGCTRGGRAVILDRQLPYS